MSDDERPEVTPPGTRSGSASPDDLLAEDSVGPEEPEIGTTPHADDQPTTAHQTMPENTLPAPPGTEPRELEVVEVREGMFGVRGTGDTSGYGGLTRPVVVPGQSPRPYGGWFDAVADRLAELIPATSAAAVEKVVVDRNQITFYVDRAHLPAVAQHLRDDEALRFEFCSGVSGVHYPEETGRELHAVYHLLSMTHNRRIRVEVTAPDDDPHIPSVVGVYPTADWHERETYDFFGIIFDGHPALTRIEMPDDWPGHPQRKDYPLGGVPVEYKGATIPPPDTRRAYN
ncbi:MAG: NADH-quinone oxidoreductase subunit C [Nocardioidaceae bacterium]